MSIKYEIADVSVSDIAEKVLHKFNKKFLHINPQDIYFAFKDSLKSKWRAETRVVGGLTSSLTTKKLAITVWKQHWVSSDDTERMLVMYHELLHIVFDEDKKKYSLLKHDLETFREMIVDLGLDEEKAIKFFGELEAVK